LARVAASSSPGRVSLEISRSVMGSFLDGYAMVLDSIGERSAEVARCNGRVPACLQNHDTLST
jgi:hypothetical protein